MVTIRVSYTRTDIELVCTQYSVVADLEVEDPEEFIERINAQQDADAISDLVCDGSEIELTQVGQEVLDTQEAGERVYTPVTYETI